VKTEKARRSFQSFVKQAWYVLEPNVEFVEGIHIDAICGRLLSAAKKLPGRIRLFDFNPDNPMAQLYAMVLVADRSTAMVGSANLSFHGMVANHELALVARGPIAEEIAARIDALTKSARTIEP
jgi:phosphatidylserine/phosphatidylglycerophosphate/cardiolipin synthase-like enzyme